LARWATWSTYYSDGERRLSAEPWLGARYRDFGFGFKFFLVARPPCCITVAISFGRPRVTKASHAERSYFHCSVHYYLDRYPNTNSTPTPRQLRRSEIQAQDSSQDSRLKLIAYKRAPKLKLSHSSRTYILTSWCLPRLVSLGGRYFSFCPHAGCLCLVHRNARAQAESIWIFGHGCALVCTSSATSFPIKKRTLQ
jgi:hypothetical protein